MDQPGQSNVQERFVTGPSGESFGLVSVVKGGAAAPDEWEVHVLLYRNRWLEERVGASTAEFPSAVFASRPFPFELAT